MNDNPASRRIRAEETLRRLVLAGRFGVAVHAIRATNSKCSKTWNNYLRNAADRLCDSEGARLTPDEAQFLRAVLLAVADGLDPRKDLDIAPVKFGHARMKPLRLEVGHEVKLRIDEGDDPGDAIAAVAQITGRTTVQVRQDFRLVQSTGKKRSTKIPSRR